jgi:hypothetical protein
VTRPSFPPDPPDPAQLAALALRQVAELLGRLDPEQLAALAAGRGRLVFQPEAPAEASPRASRPAPLASAECGELDETVRAIKALVSRSEVADYLRTHDGRLTVPVLKQVARRLGPTVATGRSKAELKRNIIEGTAGFRERSMAMSRGAWS